MALQSTDLGNSVETGRYVDVLVSDAAQALINELVEWMVGGKVGTFSARDPAVGFTVARAALNAFLQANVTGPALAGAHTVEKVFGRAASAMNSSSKQMRKACLKSLEVDGVAVYPFIPHIELFCLARYIVTGLGEGQMDGLARAEDGTSPSWVLLRLDVWHYKLFTRPSLGPGSAFNKSAQWNEVPSLRDRIEKALQELNDGILCSDAWRREDKVRFLVEKANVYIMLGQDGRARGALEQAAKLNGFTYALSGALGKRTKWQENEISQLVVLAKNKNGEKSFTDGSEAGDRAKPETLHLRDDTLLEELQFTRMDDEQKGRMADLPAPLGNMAPDVQPELSPLDQVMLLTEATLRDSFSPADSLTSEQVLPFAVRVLTDRSTNWQIYTHALLVRSRVEIHRSRTRERGVLQMQAVVDQVMADTIASREAGQPVEAAEGRDGEIRSVPAIELSTEGKKTEKVTMREPTSFLPAAKPTESAPAQVRLEFIHALSSPPRWHLESEMAYCWAGVGSLVSALEIFKRLRLWAEVALCHASNAAREDTDGRGSSGEARAKTIIRWQLFRRTDTRAGNMSAEDGREDAVEGPESEAKETDYHGPERDPHPADAPRLFCILGDLEGNPRHYERAWEISQQRFGRAQKSLGAHYSRQKEWEAAREAYRRAIHLNRTSAELWNRLGDISLRIGDFATASEAFGRAIAATDDVAAGEDAKTWSNLGSALYSLYMKRIEEARASRQGLREESKQSADPSELVDAASRDGQCAPQDPVKLLQQSLVAYKRAAGIAHDSWRIWDNVITIASRMHPPAVMDILLGLQNIIRICQDETALDADVVRLLLEHVLLSKPNPVADDDNASNSAFEPARGSPERAVWQFLESAVVPLISMRSELWEIVVRERVWRRDIGGAMDAAEKGWRTAMAGAGGCLLAAMGSGNASRNWLEDEEAWRAVVDRTIDLVRLLQRHGGKMSGTGERWRAKARSAVRSVMGKGKQCWEGTDGWTRLEEVLLGL